MSEKKSRSNPTPKGLKGKKVATSTLRFMAYTHGSVYDVVLAEVSKLKKNETHLVPIPKGVAVQTMHNRLNSAFRRTPPKMHDGLTWRKRTAINQKGDVIGIAISAIDNKAPRPGTRPKNDPSRPAGTPAKKWKKKKKPAAKKRKGKNPTGDPYAKYRNPAAAAA